MRTLLSVVAVCAACLAYAYDTADSAQTMSEAQQIAAIQSLRAKVACLSDTAVPVYTRTALLTVPTSHLEWVTDYFGAPQPEDTAGADITYTITTLARKKGANGLLEGYLVQKGCLLLPPPPKSTP